jgi:hypothetical protein
MSITVSKIKVHSLNKKDQDKNKIMSLIDYKVIDRPSCSTRTRVPKNKGKIKVTCKKCGDQFITKT